MKSAVLYRVHYWDDDVEANYKRLEERCKNSDIFIVRDITHTKCKIFDEENRKVFDISMNMCKQLGLPDHDGFYYCGDYANIIFYQAFPNYDYYASVECDVAVFNDMDYIFNDMDENKVDVVCFKQPVDYQDWYEIARSHGYEKNEHIMPAWICIHFLSQKATLHLMISRFQHAIYREKTKAQNWPYCEAVIGLLPKKFNLKFKDIREYCDHIEFYDWRCAITEESISRIDEQLKQKSFFHPVSNMEKCIRTNFDIPHKLNLRLKDRLAVINDVQFYGRAYHLPLNSQNDKNYVLDVARKNMERNNDTEYLFSEVLSLSAKASQSSLSEHSVSNNEASFALTPIPRGLHSFHTKYEEDPWWKMEFENETFVKKLFVFDRPDISRSYDLYIMAGKSEEDMSVIWRNLDRKPIGNVKTGPLVVGVEDHIKIVKICIVEYGVLNLDSVMAI